MIHKLLSLQKYGFGNKHARLWYMYVNPWSLDFDSRSQNKPDIDFFLSALSIQYLFTASNTIFNVISTKKKRAYLLTLILILIGGLLVNIRRSCLNDLL